MKVILLSCGVTVLTFLYMNLEFAAAEKSCKQVMSDLTKMQLNGITTCSKSLKFKNAKEKSKKMNCILRCVMVNIKLLDTEGYFKAPELDALIRREFPPSLYERANSTFGPCIDHADGIDPSPADEFCKSYDPFIKCLLGNLPGLCNGL